MWYIHDEIYGEEEGLDRVYWNRHTPQNECSFNIENLHKRKKYRENISILVTYMISFKNILNV